MAIYDIRCKDVARFLATGPKTLSEIGDRLHQLYPSLDPRGSYVREVLTDWNPFLVKVDGVFKLSDLGRALISLPGREGDELTEDERAFMLGVMMLDERQRKIICELILTGRSSASDAWVINQTRRCLKDLGLL